jgi:uncharacterized protein YjbI with pentapeptide repeats
MGLNLRQHDLTGANLAYADVRYVNFESSILNRAFLWFVRSKNAYFGDAGADLCRAQLQGAVFEKARLQGARLDEAQLQGADLRGAQRNSR